MPPIPRALCSGSRKEWIVGALARLTAIKRFTFGTARKLIAAPAGSDPRFGDINPSTFRKSFCFFVASTIFFNLNQIDMYLLKINLFRLSCRADVP